MMLYVHRTHKAYWGRGEGEGEEGMEGRGERGRLYTYRYTVTTRMISTLRWESEESLFNVS